MSSSSSLELTGTLSPSTLSGSPAWSVTFSIDGKYLAVCFGNPATHIKIWEHIITTTPQHNCKGASSQTSSSNNTDSSSERKKEEKEAHDITNQWRLISTIREEHTRTIRSVAFAPTSSTISVPILATASFDGKVLIWECYPDNNNATSSITTMSTADTKSNISEEDTEVINLFEPIAQLEGHENEIKCLAWNATGSLLASCGRDKTIWIWECFLPGTVGGADAAPMHHHDEPGNDDNGEYSGHVRVYQFSGPHFISEMPIHLNSYEGEWVQIGDDINGQAANDRSGASVSLSANGLVVAVGSPNNEDNGFLSGNTRVFGYKGGEWVQNGQDILGETIADQSGSSVSISADGRTVAVGSPRNRGNGFWSGSVRVYQNGLT